MASLIGVGHFAGEVGAGFVYILIMDVKKYIFVVGLAALVIYAVTKILENKGVSISNNMVYLYFYLFLLVTVFILPSSSGGGDY
jgi:hypothetical protein